MSTTDRFTIEEYEDWIESARRDHEFFERPRVELIEGEITPVSPIGRWHLDIVDLLTAWSVKAVFDLGVTVRVQGSLHLAKFQSIPLPDISWLDRKKPRSRGLRPDSIFLIIEVAHLSLAYDLTVKAKLYAKAGVADFWVVDIPARRVVVHRDSNGTSYQSVVAFEADQTIASLAFPSAVLDIGLMFKELEGVEDGIIE